MLLEHQPILYDAIYEGCALTILRDNQRETGIMEYKWKTKANISSNVDILQH